MNPDQTAPVAVNYGSHYVYVFGDEGANVFGSADLRYGWGLGYAYGRPEPRLSLKEVKAQLVYEAYFDETASFDIVNANTYAEGILGSGRWFWPTDKNGRGMYGELGVGFQYANTQTLDLDTRLNSTPILGFGGLFPVSSHELTIGLRWLHISNAGTDKPNRGENEILLVLGLRL